MTPTDTVVSEERCEVDAAHVKAMIEAVGHAGRNGVYHATTSSGDLTIYGPTAKELLAELLDRRTATPQSGGVVVKGLEWAKNGPASLWTGELIFGVYYVADEEGDRWRVVRGQFLSEAGMTEIAFGSLDTVKAAAQADYEAHIRSTLADPIPEAPADEEVEAELRRQADAAYIRYINLMGTKPCLGVEAKLASGEFGAANLDAHREASEALGRHRGINAAIDILRAIRRSTETDKPGVREALEALRPFAEAFAKADDPGVSDLYNEQCALGLAQVICAPSPFQHGRREVSVPHGERPLAEQIRFRLFQAKLWREYAMMHDGWAPSHWPGGHRLRTGGWPTPQAWITSMMPKSTRARCLQQSRINVRLAQRLRRRLANV